MNEDLQQQIEEAKAQIPAGEETTPEAEVTPEVDPIEQKAIEMGWKPDFKGPNAVTAKEFVERGSFFRKIDAQNKKIDELLGVVKGLSDHNQKVAEASYKKGVEDALIKKRDAIRSGDLDGVNQAELELKNLEAIRNVPQVAEVPAQNVVTQDMLDWVEENKSWFNNTSPEHQMMVKKADGLFYLESQNNPHKSQKEVLEIVKNQIAALYPEKFENPNKSKPIAVTRGSASTGSSKAVGLSARLTEKQQTFYKQAKQAGVQMTIEEYAKQLESTGDLKND